MIDLTTLTARPWLMEPDHLAGLLRRAAAARDLPTPGQLAEAREAQAKALRRVSGRVAVLPVHGVVEHRMTGLGYWYGGFSTEAGEQALDHLLAAKDVEAIVLDVDSPGGTSYGVEEFADRVYEARAKKQVVAVANSMSASAAYWIASAAGQVVVTPGGDVGSVGVYAAHVDLSQALGEAGIKVSIVRTPKYKAEGNPYEPLTAEARDHLQEMVDATYGKFVKAVARHRGVPPGDVRGQYGQGRLVSADRALEAGMVDRVATFSQVMEKLTGGGWQDPGRDRRASLEVLRLRHQQRKRRAGPA